MKKWFVALFGMALHVSLAVSVLACEKPEEKIIWMDSTKKSAMFIPEKLLREVDWSKLPLKNSDRDSLAAYIKRPEHLAEMKRLLGREEALCIEPRSLNEGGSSSNAKDLSAWIKHFKTGVIGKVKKVVPGWSSWESQVVTMVYAEVLDTLRENSSPQVGTLLAYRLPYGSIHLKSTEICRDPWPNFKAPSEGDRILLLGDPYKPNPKFLEFTFVFPIEDELVRYQPYSDVKKFDSIEIRELL